MTRFLNCLAVAMLMASAPPHAAAQDVAALCDALAGDPDDPTLSVEGVIHQDIDPEAAEAPCREAVAADPADARLRYQLGRVLDKKGNYEEALALYEAAEAEGHGIASVTIGMLYEYGDGVEQDYGKAAAYYRKAAEADLLAGIWHLGTLYDQGLGVPQNAEEAARLYRLGVERDDPYAFTALGLLHEDGRGVPKDPAEAERLYRRAIASDVRAASTDAKNTLAWMFARAGTNLDEAEQLAIEAVADDEIASYLDTLGWVRHRLGRDEEAARDLERAVELDDSLADIHNRLGDIYAALGRHEDAKTAWRRALELPDPDPSTSPEWDRAAVEAKLTAAP